MLEKYIAVGVLAGVALLLIYISTREDFATKREKAQSIYDWFIQNPHGGYADYRSDLRGQSNIVEYEDVSARAHAPDFTLAAVEAVI